MADTASTSPARVWAMRLVYFGLCLMMLLLQLLPQQTLPRDLSGPDMIIVLSCAIALRRPDFVPAALVAFVMVLADLLLLRPPGLMAAITVIATEGLRIRARGLRDLPFTVEWLTAGFAMAGIVLAYRLILAVFLIPEADWLLTFSQIFANILAYPLVVVSILALFGVRRAAPGEVDKLGHEY